MDIRALFFDVFGTVVDWRESIAGQVAQFNSDQGTAFEPYALADAWRGRYYAGMAPVLAGRREFAKLETLHLENLRAVLAEMPAIELSDDQLDEMNGFWRRLRPWPDSVAGLARLKHRHILATMSNGNIAMMVAIAKFAGLPWDVILGAEPAGTYKPDPRCYITGTEILGLRPQECIMVAAHNKDLVAAAALGFRTAFIRRPTEHGPGQSGDLEPEREFDYVAGSMEELASRMGC